MEGHPCWGTTCQIAKGGDLDGSAQGKASRHDMSERPHQLSGREASDSPLNTCNAPHATLAYLDVSVKGWVDTVDCQMDGQRCGEGEGCHDHVAGSREAEDLKAILLEPFDLLFRGLCVPLAQDAAYGKAALLRRHLIEGDRQRVRKRKRGLKLVKTSTCRAWRQEMTINQ